MRLPAEDESVLFHFGRESALPAVGRSFGLADQVIANQAGYPQKEDQCTGAQQECSVMLSQRAQGGVDVIR